jgi:hypothetical protein
VMPSFFLQYSLDLIEGSERRKSGRFLMSIIRCSIRIGQFLISLVSGGDNETLEGLFGHGSQSGAALAG